MELYFDESGNLGKKDRYFVIAMLLPVNKKRIINFVKRFCAKLGHDEIKASRLNFTQKQNLIYKLSKIPDNKISYIVADKLKIKSQKLLSDTNLCFNYLFMQLVQTADLAANTIYARYNYNRKHLYNMLNISESIRFPYEKFGK